MPYRLAGAGAAGVVPAWLQEVLLVAERRLPDGAGDDALHGRGPGVTRLVRLDAGDQRAEVDVSDVHGVGGQAQELLRQPTPSITASRPLGLTPPSWTCSANLRITLRRWGDDHK